MDHVRQLKWILESANVTQQALADRLNVSLVSLNAWINGRAHPRVKSLQVIDKICAELAVTQPASFRRLLATESATPHHSHEPALSADQIEQLIHGGGDAETIEILRESQYRALLKRLGKVVAMAPQNSLTEAMLLLDSAKEIDPMACREVLTYPHVSVWVSSVLQKHLEKSSLDDARHLAHFSSVAAVAAWRSGITDFAIQVPVVNRQVFFPGLGRALISDAIDAEISATVTCSAGQMSLVCGDAVVLVPQDPRRQSDEWEPLRTVVLDNNGLRLHLVLDDMDPNREGGTSRPSGFPPAKLDSLDYKAWKEQLQDAWRLLTRDHHEYAAGIAAAVRVVVPIEPGVTHETAFSRDGFGAIVSTLGPSPSSLAHSMLEEFQRMKINALHSLTKLHTATSDMTMYLVGYCARPVPFDSMVETFYSSAASSDFWHARYCDAFGAERLEAAVNFQLRRTWQYSLRYRLMESGELTALGRMLVEVVSRHAEQDQRDVDRSVVDFVRRLKVDRRLSVRLASLQPDDDEIKRLAIAWIAGMACPVDSSVHVSLTMPYPELVGWKRRRELEELRLSPAGSQRFEDVIENEHYLDIVIPGATLADGCLVAGRFDDAQRRYLEAIDRNGQDIESWAGLALVVAEAGVGTSVSLGRFPEIVFALHRCLHAMHGQSINPIQLAQWLEPLLVQMNDLSFEDKFGHTSGGFDVVG